MGGGLECPRELVEFAVTMQQLPRAVVVGEGPRVCYHTSSDRNEVEKGVLYFRPELCLGDRVLSQLQQRNVDVDAVVGDDGAPRAAVLLGLDEAVRLEFV